MVFWRTNKGVDCLVTDMATRHIQNCINCIKGIGGCTIPNPHVGVTHKKWLEVFEQELYCRQNKEIIYECWI